MITALTMMYDCSNWSTTSASSSRGSWRFWVGKDSNTTAKWSEAESLKGLLLGSPVKTMLVIGD
jgi:hypothetical protein